MYINNKIRYHKWTDWVISIKMIKKEKKKKKKKTNFFQLTKHW